MNRLLLNMLSVNPCAASYNSPWWQHHVAVFLGGVSRWGLRFLLLDSFSDSL